MRTDDLDFDLPPELIAQTPAADRHASRLLHYRRADRSIAHRTFSDLPSLLRPGDLLVFNDARVLPARLMLRKDTGGLVEGLYLEELRTGEWRVLLKNVGKNPVGLEMRFADDPGRSLRVVDKHGGGEFTVAVTPRESAWGFLERVGRMPLPPYIKRDKARDERDDLDRERYQTVFARARGSVAAPTAALHFSDDVISALKERGVNLTFVTLNVGRGTFQPVTADHLDDHAMHVESYLIGGGACNVLNRAKADGRRIVAVGTTSARVLESQPAGEPFAERMGETEIFIRPGYAWKHVGALVTNFHLPRSTLIALVAAMVGLDEQRRVYRIAVEEQYRFFSYGDAMLIE